MTPERQIVELVSNFTLEGDVTVDDLLDGALAILVAAIGNLPPERREDVLVGLEDEMRRRVHFFVERCAALQAKRRLQ